MMLFVCDIMRTHTVPLTPIKGKAWRCVWLLLCLTFAPVVPVYADVTDGRFSIASATTVVGEDVLYLEAQVNYSLSTGAMEALHSGVPLTFETQIGLDRVRAYLPDPNIVTLTQRSRLTYHALTQRFIVTNLNSSEQSSYGTLAEALARIGSFQRLPVVDISLLNDRAVYRMKMRSVLDTKSFPAPLRMLAALFRIDDWRLSSGWQRWLVTI